MELSTILIKQKYKPSLLYRGQLTACTDPYSIQKQQLRNDLQQVARTDSIALKTTTATPHAIQKQV